MDNEIEIAYKNARSFKGFPPNGSKFIGAKRTCADTYFFFKDEAGNYYFDSENQRTMEREMKEAERRKREQRRQERRTWRN